MKPSVIIEPYGGLGNRIRSLASGLWVCSLRGESMLGIVWSQNSELNIPLDQLFEINKNWVLTEYPGVTYGSIQKNPFKRIITFIINNLRIGNKKVMKDRDLKNYWKDPTSFEKQLMDQKGLYLHTCEAFGDYRDFLGAIRPSVGIQEELKAQLEIWNFGYIGVHIRRTDHVQAIANSPIEGFQKQMEEILKTNKSEKFYVTSDDEMVETFFKDQFGDSILSRDKLRSRNEADGVKAAFVDLLLLANSNRILGSFSSSFSQIAAEVGGVSLNIING